MRTNPYSLSFGRAPHTIISRPVERSVILSSFCAPIPSQQAYMITGIRGAGKTVLMTEISHELKSKDNWIVVELNPERDLLASLAAKLCSENHLAKIFQSAQINLSFFGIGLDVKGQVAITDIETALSRMLESLKKSGKRVLVAIDEVVNTSHMRTFAGAFQIFIRQDLPLFLLMTGLFENINALQNEKSLTFLYRTPKVELKPLNMRVIAESYQKTFAFEDDSAQKMAFLTRGYSFAFQVLGYLTWENDGHYTEVVPDYQQYLEDYVYEKIWAGMSRMDRFIAFGIASSETGKISEIRQILQLETNQFNPYRKRLIQRGLINGDEYGYVRFILPLFEQFVLANFEAASPTE